MVPACCTVAGIALRVLDQLEERNNFTTIVQGTIHVTREWKEGEGRSYTSFSTPPSCRPSKRQHLHISLCDRKNYPASQRQAGSLNDTLAISTPALDHLIEE